MLLAGELVRRKSPSFRVRLFDTDGSQLFEQTFDLSPETLELENNLPEMNIGVVRFCSDHFNKRVGSGICAALAGEALTAANADRRSMYTWGRELDSQEAVLPGDIAQMENLRLTGPDRFEKNFNHHTAVVVDVTKEGLVLNHQNVGRKGKVVQRDVWHPRFNVRVGRLVFFRPTIGKTGLPDVSPRRVLLPEVNVASSQIDLLKVIDPVLDSVQGIWYQDKGLTWNRDSYTSLQVPVTPPDKYRMRMKLPERLVRVEWESGFRQAVTPHQFRSTDSVRRQKRKSAASVSSMEKMQIATRRDIRARLFLQT